jgi:Flp pilus assembly pilin Flp
MIDRANVLLLTLVSAASAGVASAASAGTERLRREEGQTFVEYALVILLIAVAVGTLAAWDGLREAITTAIGDMTDAISNAGDG